MDDLTDGVYVRVGEDDKKVLLLFTRDPEGSTPANISQWRVDPEDCLPIAESMVKHAFSIDSGLTPVGPALKAGLIEQHRVKLTQRFTLMLGSVRGDKLKSDGEVARDLVDAALREIF